MNQILLGELNITFTLRTPTALQGQTTPARTGAAATDRAAFGGRLAGMNGLGNGATATSQATRKRTRRRGKAKAKAAA